LFSAKRKPRHESAAGLSNPFGEVHVGTGTVAELMPAHIHPCKGGYRLVIITNDY
jgi:hypothetical protein